MFLGSVLKSARRVIAATGLAALAGLAVPHAASAQSIDDILSKKKLTIGMLVDLPPFGLLDAQGKPEGYDADVAKLMGKYLGVEVEIVPVTGPNRIPYLLTNKVDALVATFGITPERAKQVQFSIPYSAIEIQLLGPKKLDVKTLDQTVGKKIAVARASTQDTALTAAVPKGATIMRFDDDATAAQAFISGQTDLLGSNNVIGAQLAEANPDMGIERKIVLRSQYNGITVRRGSTDFLQWINTFLYFVKNNGELDAINQKWFKTPLGPLPTF
ncbi:MULTISPECIES: transporter substrate-binding domain-containing protein [Azorhizobium]|uniref:Putative ABC transporter periplasmic solute-binding protein n=1 Tax=Azorhizobium caulinodans (strain ATCC 43989 / DSM 5975 / JCM 20966 / LMG 6465 / NBRC 14845 / NCIMB 13405 / ORS 571) TaxID=438753 RepID=A8HW97_AZOC5|nr:MULTISPECIES: transporter substrate-binding domain-containing protein [Azorhizobium]TDT89579.1 amino acid ABC transporter substrate-binding protein (PAAT family) [Azorhizobium sp. AG788]BAF90405.1 putative ABC transporter periplasmic solute-binding protein [Azorhizobium caulinodans ORS 571]